MGFGPRRKKKIFGPHSKEKSNETKQISYARWPLAASVVKTTNYYLITSDPTEKGKFYATQSGPGPVPSFGPAGPGHLYPPPPPPTRLVGIALKVRTMKISLLGCEDV